MKPWLLIIVGLLLTSCGLSTLNLANTHQISGQIFVVTEGRENIKLGLVRVYAMPYGAAIAAINGAMPDENTAMQAVSDKYDKEIGELKDQFDDVMAQRKAATQEGTAAVQEAADSQPTADSSDPDELNRQLQTTDAKIAAAKAKLDEEQSHLRDLDEIGAPLAKKLDELIAEKKRWQESGLIPLKPLADALSKVRPIATAETDADGKFVLTGLPNASVALVAVTTRATMGGSEDYLWVVPVAPNVTSVLLSNDGLITTVDNLKTLHDPATDSSTDTSN